MSYPRLFTTPGLGEFAEAVDDERARQLAKWGDQRHPDLDPQSYTATDRDSYFLEAQRWQRLNALRARDGRTAWDGILLEEVYEALGEDDPVKLRAKLVQTAAVIAAWISDLDRRPAADAAARMQDWVAASGVYDDQEG